MVNEQRKHILIMSSWYPSGPGDFTGNFVERFANLLSGHYRVSVIHTLGDSSSKELRTVISEESGVKTIRIFHPVFKNKLAHWWWQRTALKAAFNEAHEVDLIFGHVILKRGLQFIAAKKHYNCPLIVLEHASYYRRPDQFTLLQRTILKRTANYTDELCACSEFLADAMQGVFPGKKISVISNVVDEHSFYPSGETNTSRHRFLHVSTLAPVKQPELLIAAVSDCVKAGFTQTLLTVISDQPTADLEQATALAGISDHIRFEGPLDWETVAARFREHDTFVLCSAYETFSIVLVEAWLTGIPVITTPVGIGRNLPMALGIQIPLNDVGALARAMQRRMDGSTSYDSDRLRQAGLQFSSPKVLDRLTNLFDQHFKSHG